MVVHGLRNLDEAGNVAAGHGLGQLGFGGLDVFLGGVRPLRKAFFMIILSFSSTSSQVQLRRYTGIGTKILGPRDPNKHQMRTQSPGVILTWLF